MLILIILFVTPMANCGKYTVPVMVIDFDNVIDSWNITSNPINIVKSHELNELLYKVALTKATVIIYTEKKLSLEDLTAKDSLGSPYRNLEPYKLHNGVKFMYSVDHAYKILNLTFPRTPRNTYDLSTYTSDLQKIDPTKAIYVYFSEDANETRTSMLRKHSVIVEETCKLVASLNQKPVIGFYTGMENPNQRHTILFKATKPVNNTLDAPVSILTEGAAFKLANIFITRKSVRSGISQMPFIASETWTDKGMSILMSYTDFELLFNFEFYQNAWKLRSIVAMVDHAEVGRLETYITAPWNCSFYCSMPLEIPIKGDKSSITISKYHLMPFNRPLRQETFGPLFTVQQFLALRSPKHCGPNFSTTIIAGIALSVFCIGIALVGVTMLMNCHAYDRFEDPNGKKLQISEKL